MVEQETLRQRTLEPRNQLGGGKARTSRTRDGPHRIPKRQQNVRRPCARVTKKRVHTVRPALDTDLNGGKQ